MKFLKGCFLLFLLSCIGCNAATTLSTNAVLRNWFTTNIVTVNTNELGTNALTLSLLHLDASDILFSTNVISYGGVAMTGGDGDVTESGSTTTLDAVGIGKWLNFGTNLGNSTSVTLPAYARGTISGYGINNLDRQLINQIALGSLSVSNAHWLGKWIRDRSISYDILGRVGIGTVTNELNAWLEINCDKTTNYEFIVNANSLTVTNGNTGIGTNRPAYKLDVLGEIHSQGHTLNGVLELVPFSTVTTRTNIFFWNSNNSALFVRGTNGADKPLLSFP